MYWNVKVISVFIHLMTHNVKCAHTGEEARLFCGVQLEYLYQYLLRKNFLNRLNGARSKQCKVIRCDFLFIFFLGIKLLTRKNHGKIVLRYRRVVKTVGFGGKSRGLSFICSLNTSCNSYRHDRLGGLKTVVKKDFIWRWCSFVSYTIFNFSNWLLNTEKGFKLKK